MNTILVVGDSALDSAEIFDSLHLLHLSRRSECLLQQREQISPLLVLGNLQLLRPKVGTGRGAARIGVGYDPPKGVTMVEGTGTWKYVFEVLRYGLGLAAWKVCLYKFAYYVHDHIAPVARMNKAGRPRIHPTASLRCGENISLGYNSHINAYCCIWASPHSKIVLGDNLLMGPGTKIFSSNHRAELGTPMTEQSWEEKDIVIGNDVWLGANVVVVPGVRIGNGSIVAAGAVVTRDIAPNRIVGGVPARTIKGRE